MACHFTFKDKDGTEITIIGKPAMQAYLADGGLEHLFPGKVFPWSEVASEPAKESIESYIDYHKAIDKRIVDGDISTSELKSEFEKLVDNRDAVISELSKLTKDKLKAFRIGYMRPDAIKKDYVEAVYKGMLADFKVSDDMVSFPYDPDSKEEPWQPYIRAVRKFVDKTTDDDIKAYADSIKKAKAERESKLEEVKKGLDNPITLDDYTRVLRSKMNNGLSLKQAYKELDPDQRAQFDELYGNKTRSERKVQSSNKVDVKVTAQTTSGDIVETKHTKTGEDLFVVKTAERVERDVYNEWLATAKKMGGWYSSFRGTGAVPGFQFKTKENAEAFLKYIGGDINQAQEAIQVKRDAYADDKTQSVVERLNEMAGKLDEKADESLGRDRKANTHRRAGQAARAEAAANADKAMAQTMRNIAQAIESGKANFLDRVRQKTQVELMQSIVNTAQYDKQRELYPSYADQLKHQGEKPDSETASYVEYPNYTAYRSDLAGLGRTLSEVEGTKKLGKRLLDVANDVNDIYLKFAKENLDKLSSFTLKDSAKAATFKSKSDAEEAISRSGYDGKAIVLAYKRGDNRIILSPSEAIKRGIWKGNDERVTLSDELGAELVEKLGKANRRGNKISIPWQFENAYEKQKRLSAMGIEKPAELRAAIREFISLQQQAKEPDKIKEMERAMIGRANDGLDFFPTPAHIADEMVQAADLKEGMSVLEPSAGMGHIAERIREVGVEPDVVELSNKRKELLEAKGFNVVGSDFMDVTGNYDRIIMNPPFSDRRDMAHVQHAYDLLNPGGRLVAIMGEGVFFGSDKKAQDFRAWLEEHNGTDEKLDEGTFKDPSLPVTTGVNARLIVISKLDNLSSFNGGVESSGGISKSFGGSANTKTSRDKFINSLPIINKLSLAIVDLESLSSKGFDDGISSNSKKPTNSITTNSFRDELNSLINVPSRLLGGVDPLFSEAARNGASIDAFFFGDVIKGSSIRSNGFNALNVDIKSMVKTKVLGRIKDVKVLNAVIKLVPINVMNDLIGRETSSYELLHNESVLSNLIAASSDIPIFFDRFIDSIATSIPLSEASFIAEKMTLLGDNIGISFDGLIAKITSDYGHDISLNEKINYPINSDKDANMIVVDKPNDALKLSQSSQKLLGSTIAQVQDMLPAKARKLYATGKLVIVQSVQDLPASLFNKGAAQQESLSSATAKRIADAEALYFPSEDKIFLVADNLNKNNTMQILSHELLHRAEFTDTKLQDAIKKFESDFQKRFDLAGRGFGTPIELAAYDRIIRIKKNEFKAAIHEIDKSSSNALINTMFNSARKGIGSKEELQIYNKVMQDALEEFRAYMVTEYANNPQSITGKLKRIIADFIAAIRVALVRAGLDFGMVRSLSPSDLFAMSGYGANVNGVTQGNSGVMASFAGELADTTDQYQLTNAKQLIESGIDPEKVRQDTGWFKGVDGKWRFEIDDSDARLKIKNFSEYRDSAINLTEKQNNEYEKLYAKDLTHYLSEKEKIKLKNYEEIKSEYRKKQNDYFKLKDILSHDALYSAYPYLLGLNVKVNKALSKGEGIYNNDYKTISLPDGTIDLKDIMHEIQHSIQSHEDFSRGGSPSSEGDISKYLSLSGEVESRNVESRLALTSSQRKSTPPSTTQDVPDNDVIVVFNGEEMRSAPTPANATANIGEFNPDNPDIRFSMRDSVDEINSSIREAFSPRQGKQSLDWLAGLFQRNHLIDFVAKELPMLEDYKTLSQEKDNTINKHEREIAERYAEMKDSMTHDVMNELGRVQGLATRLKFDPAKFDDGNPTQADINSLRSDKKAIYLDYMELPDGAKKTYKMMREDYKKDLLSKKSALIKRLDDFPIDRETKAGIIKQIEFYFDQPIKDGVYFPLTRDGDRVVTADKLDDDGNIIPSERIVEFVENAKQADRLMQELKEMGYKNRRSDKKSVYIKSLATTNAANNIAALAIKAIADLQTNIQQQGADATLDFSGFTANDIIKGGDFKQLIDDFNQQLIDALPDTSYRKHFIHRKGTLGYSTDTLRGYAGTRTAAAKNIASLLYDHKIYGKIQDAKDAIKNISNGEDEDTRVESLRSVLNELEKREEKLKDSSISQASQILTSLGFMGALGFNVASAAVNMLQVPGVTLPELSGKHGFTQAAAEINKAYKLLFNKDVLNKHSGFDLSKNPELNKPQNAQLKAALIKLNEIGKIDLTLTHEAISMGQNPSYSDNAVTRTVGGIGRYSGYLFHVAEALNRQITGIAAFNLAYRKNGGNFDEAFKDAVDVIDRTQFDYSQSNRARYMMSDTARVLTLFKSYALGISYYIGRNVHNSLLKGNTPEIKAMRLAARKAVVTQMAMTFATSGLFGLPIGGEALAVLGGVAGFKYKGANFAVPGAVGGMLLFQALLSGLGADDEDDVEVQFRNWLTDNFDQTTAEWIVKGPARLLPMGDISSRTGLSDIWWRPQNKELEGKDQYQAFANALLGPLGSQFAGLFTATKMYQDGEYSRAIEAMSPAAIRNIIAAARMENEGVKTIKGDPIVNRDLTMTEIANKVLGFNPTVVTNNYDANTAIAKARDRIAMKKAHLVNRYISSDPQERADLMRGDIKDFNSEVEPQERITIGSLMKSIRQRKALDRRTENGLYLSKKSEHLRDIGRFGKED